MAYSKQIKKIHAKKHPVKKRTEDERERDLEIIARLFLTVKPTLQQAAILLRQETHAEYTISLQQISYDLDTLRKRWRGSANEKIDQIKFKELAKIDILEKEAWDSWFKSKGEQEIKSEKKQDKKVIDTIIKTENCYGDTKYMNLITWCIDKRIEILGIKEATKIKVSVSKEEERKFTSPEQLDKEIEIATSALNEINIDIANFQNN